MPILTYVEKGVMGNRRLQRPQRSQRPKSQQHVKVIKSGEEAGSKQKGKDNEEVKKKRNITCPTHVLFFFFPIQ